MKNITPNIPGHTEMVEHMKKQYQKELKNLDTEIEKLKNALDPIEAIYTNPELTDGKTITSNWVNTYNTEEDWMSPLTNEDWKTIETDIKNHYTKLLKEEKTTAEEIEGLDYNQITLDKTLDTLFLLPYKKEVQHQDWLTHRHHHGSYPITERGSIAEQGLKNAINTFTETLNIEEEFTKELLKNIIYEHFSYYGNNNYWEHNNWNTFLTQENVWTQIW